MIAAVADGEIDMAFGVFPTLPSRCEADTLFEDAYVCVPLDQVRAALRHQNRARRYRTPTFCAWAIVP